MPKTKEPEQASINLVGLGTSIVGDVKSDGDMRIDGSITGTISSSGRIIIGDSGIVEGEIVCQSFEISGTLKGKVEVVGLATIKETAKLNGDITTSKLAIEPGAVFTGSCKMQSPSLESKNENK